MSDKTIAQSQNLKVPQRWAVLGIQQAVFKRILPHIIHDVVSPLSVALLQTGLIKRKLKVDQPNCAEMWRHAEELDQNLRQGVVLIRAIKDWEGETDHFFSAENIFQQSIKCFRTKLAMRGIELEWVKSEVEMLKTAEFQALLYCWLALLCYLEDTIQSAIKISVQQVENNTVLLQFQEKTGGYIPAETGSSVSESENVDNESIGLQELAMLSEYYGISIQHNAESITFKW